MINRYLVLLICPLLLGLRLMGYAWGINFLEQLERQAHHLIREEQELMKLAIILDWSILGEMISVIVDHQQTVMVWQILQQPIILIMTAHRFQQMLIPVPLLLTEPCL